MNAMVKHNQTGRVSFSPQRYRRLVSATLPQKIYSEADYERTAEASLELARKEAANQATAEEIALLELLYVLLEEYERRAEPLAPAPPHEILQHYLQARGMKQKDLLGIYDSEGAISDAVSGRRAIAKEKAKKLAQMFGVPVELFL